MVIIGIDPGATGALAFLDTNTGVINVQDMPAILVQQGMRRVHRVSAALLAALIDVHGGGPMMAYVEQVASMPNQGVSSVFAFGRAAGIVEGVLAALCIPTIFIPPQTWMRGVGLAGAVKDRKEASRGKACQLYPASAQTFARVKDHGRAEAALIAHFGASLLHKEARSA